MMSLEKFAVLFIIIVLPISIILNVYTEYQIKTLNLQTSYDAKLDKATADAVKAYQLNAFNEGTSGLTSSKLRNIEAAAGTFFNSMKASFNMEGYDQDYIGSYVPALVFTTYDGYYVYSKYTNTLPSDKYSDSEKAKNNGRTEPSTYQGGIDMYGTKPFVSYSCRYKMGGNSDFVISYTLDNYISIQGTVNGNWQNVSGYVINPYNITDINETNGSLKYKEKQINREVLRESIVVDNSSTGKKEEQNLVYHKINGIKYYNSNNNFTKDGGQWFHIVNGKKEDVKELPESDVYRDDDLRYDYSAYNYYKKAKEFSEKIMGISSNKEINISNLKPSNAVDFEFLNYSDPNSPFLNVTDINDKIEEFESNFNHHRRAIIKYTIEKNLSVAIKNYNKYATKDASGNEHTSYTDFEMPKLNETEWDKIMNNLTVISFLQGLPIGTRLYNGCSVVPNNKNDEVVAEESIYITDISSEQGIYYNSKYRGFNKNTTSGNYKDLRGLGKSSLFGVYNINFEKWSVTYDDQKYYYNPKNYLASYDSVVSASENVNIHSDTTDTQGYNYAYNGDIYRYMKDNVTDAVASTYFTALGRERYSSYKVFRTANS